MQAAIIAAIAVLATTACSSASQSSASQPSANQGSVAVIVQPEGSLAPTSKEKFCYYSGRMVSSCAFQSVLSKYQDPEASIAEVGAAFTEIQAQQNTYTLACMNQLMTTQQADANWACLESLTSCSQMNRCVKNNPTSDPSDDPSLQLLQRKQGMP